MNPETGEIIMDPSEEQIKTQKLIPIPSAVLPYLEDVPPARRTEAYQNWKDYEEEEKFNNTFEKSKSRKAFFFAFAAACHGGLHESIND